ncbi:MAG TPA: DMT family protein [Bacteroidales bacterium]|nr:DMT family protein [Bacteroidales bacterium]
MKGISTILMLMMSNAFMTVAWYGHLKLKTMSRFENMSLLAVILLSWGIAFFEYSLQIPANRFGFKGNGGPFSLIELKIIQEVISIMVFTVFTLLVFRNEQFRLNHVIGFFFLILAVYFIFKK